MILAVFVDIEGFLWILLSSCLVFSITFETISKGLNEKGLQIENSSIHESIKMSYRLIYGDFKEGFDIESLIGFFFFMVATLFMVVIMLNLLISIISDTFDRIQMD